jgi:hypothetical protein
MTRSPLSPARLFLVSSLAGLCALAAAPEPTPTPPPRLTGGFGKTPVAGRTATRDAGKTGPVRITNQSLVTDTARGKVSTSQSRPPSTTPEPAKTPAARAGSAPAETGTASADTGQGEAYWREESRRLRERVTELRDTITRLEADTKRLEADYYAWDDGAYRDKVIKPSWDKAREEIATARLALPIAEKDLADLPDRARRAGALPGWLRE